MTLTKDDLTTPSLQCTFVYSPDNMLCRVVLGVLYGMHIVRPNAVGLRTRMDRSMELVSMQCIVDSAVCVGDNIAYADFGGAKP